MPTQADGEGKESESKRSPPPRSPTSSYHPPSLPRIAARPCTVARRMNTAGYPAVPIEIDMPWQGWKDAMSISIRRQGGWGGAEKTRGNRGRTNGSTNSRSDQGLTNHLHVPLDTHTTPHTSWFRNENLHDDQMISGATQKKFRRRLSATAQP